MSHAIELALVQTHPWVGDTKRNVERAKALASRAAEEGADLIVLPEFFSTGYFPLYWNYNYMKLAEDEGGRTVSTFRDLASKHQTYFAVTFFEIESPGLYYDTCVVISPSGDIVAKYRKTHPPSRVSLEKLFYKGASRLPVFDILGWKLGILICYDTYVTEPARVLMVQGAEIIIAPFAEVEGFDMWTPLLRTRAFENGVYVAACNLVGPDSESAKAVMGGASIVIDPEGGVLDQAPSDREATVRARLTRECLVDSRTRRQFIRDRRPELYGVLTATDEEARSLSNGAAVHRGAGTLSAARERPDDSQLAPRAERTE